MSPPSPSLILLDSYVCTDLPSDCTVVPLSSGGVQVFGFNDDDKPIDPAVHGLVLEAHLAVAPDLSFLALRGGSFVTSINTVDKNLIVLSSAFPEKHDREIDLIFDATDRVLAVRHHDDIDASSYSLVIPGTAAFSASAEGFAERHDVLFIYSPTSPSSASPPWYMRKKANFPEPRLVDNFFADEVFSFRGRGYWADLLCGVMHCDCGDVLSDGVDPVDFSFFHLPGPHLTDPRGRDAVAGLAAFRAIGCVGGAIKFVSIDGYINRMDSKNIRDRSVTIWRLTEDLRWEVEDELNMKSLWAMLPAEFYRRNYTTTTTTRKRRPSKTSLAPMYPFLSTQEDRVVYLALGEFSQGTSGGSFPTVVHFLLRVDMRHRNVSFAPVPYSPNPTLDRFIGFDYSILCPPASVAVEAKMNNRSEG